jgi:hypothetical protein
MAGRKHEADFIATFGVPETGFVRGYTKVDIDETTLSVRIAFADGVTGEEVYCVQELGVSPAGELGAVRGLLEL